MSYLSSITIEFVLLLVRLSCFLKIRKRKGPVVFIFGQKSKKVLESSFLHRKSSEASKMVILVKKFKIDPPLCVLYTGLQQDRERKCVITQSRCRVCLPPAQYLQAEILHKQGKDKFAS